MFVVVVVVFVVLFVVDYYKHCPPKLVSIVHVSLNTCVSCIHEFTIDVSSLAMADK